MKNIRAPKREDQRRGHMRCNKACLSHHWCFNAAATCSMISRAIAMAVYSCKGLMDSAKASLAGTKSGKGNTPNTTTG